MSSGSLGLRMVGYQPSPRRPARRRAAAPSPPTQIGSRLLHRLGLEQHVAEGDELALIARRGLSPQRPERLDVLVRRRAALVVGRRAQRRHLLRHPAHAEAERDAPLGQAIRRRQHLGGEDRRPVRRHHHRGQQADALGHGRGVGQARDLLQAEARAHGRPVAALVVGIARGDAAGDHDVVAEAEIGEARAARRVAPAPEGCPGPTPRRGSPDASRSPRCVSPQVVPSARRPLSPPCGERENWPQPQATE